MKIYIAHSSDFNFRTKLYEPLRRSVLNEQYEILLPQEHGREAITKDMIRECGAVVADVSLPSTGSGIEMGWANSFGIPVICIHEKGSTPSSAAKYVSDTFIEYEGTDELVKFLGEALLKV